MKNKHSRILGFFALISLTISAVVSSPVWANGAAEQSFQEINWLELVPADWNPQERLSNKLKEAESVSDEDERAQEMMEELREILDTAPTVEALNGRAVKLPGYVVPLEETQAGLTEFLLVPYFGACIHTPPPPANQIIHVISARPIKGFKAMSAVWVNGMISTSRTDSGMGVSGYALELSEMELYQR